MVCYLTKFSFMEEWIRIKLSDCCESISDGDHMPPPKVSFGIPFITISNIKDNQVNLSDTFFVPQSYYEALDEKRKPQKGDILYTVVGTFGIPVLIKEETRFVFQRHIAILRPNHRVDSRFLYYCLLSPAFYRIADRLAIGAVQRTIGLKSLREQEIFIPKRIEEQKRIADILSSIDDKITLNNRINHNLEEQAQALYRSWFVDFKPFKSGKFVDSELGLIPDGWHVGTLSELVEVRYGKDHKMLNDGRIPVYGSGGLMRYADRSLFESESVLIPRKGTLNNVMYVNHPFWTVDTMFYTIGKTVHVIKYAHLFLLTQDLASMNAGSAVPSMTTDILNKLPILIPTLEVLNTFDTVVSSVYSIIRSDQVENASLASIRDSILPQLMSGVIDINSLNC